MSVNHSGIDWQAECCQAIDTVATLYRRLAVERLMTSEALTICHAQHTQIVAKDETIARLRQELREARTNRRAA